jgi:hypothetical protein
LHNYERTLPVFNGTSTCNGSRTHGEISSDGGCYDRPNATVHVVVGNAGDDEGLTDRWVDPLPAWSAHHDGSRLGFARLTFRSSSGSHVF